MSTVFSPAHWHLLGRPVISTDRVSIRVGEPQLIQRTMLCSRPRNFVFLAKPRSERPRSHSYPCLPKKKKEKKKSTRRSVIHKIKIKASKGGRATATQITRVSE
jgi:hypothetical protein